MSDKVYDIIAERILERLESGVIPWRKPWSIEGAPANLISGKDYRGVNVFMLASSGFSSRWWLTYKQATQRGGQVKQGERGSPVVFWNFLDREKDGKKSQVPFLRYYTVFNTSQCEGLETPASEAGRTHDPIQACEAIVRAMPSAPRLTHGKAQAFYHPGEDYVAMPDPERFVSSEAYYGVLFHELTHSTGHKDRLNRTFGRQGTGDYGREELVAEMGAAFLAGVAGIDLSTLDNSVAYISNWVKAIRSDKRAVVVAAGAAQRASDFILGRSLEKTEAA